MRFSAPSLKLELRESIPFNHKHTFCVMGLSGGCLVQGPSDPYSQPEFRGNMAIKIVDRIEDLGFERRK